ncbi:hypothetical protein CONLIGDRAFT_702703 [Coniochaeta ligniaria NRRL 30616]|uniref:Uncharacterized protein n=1 Tax=Coniochaeta ligniaria NRRL 30616 TaxID=1408157 RepID=A0A1J7JLI3_9PEZI|nr:hypothetical protein CONLIGDRAFT_702703 [Coniochaeta ligniaria NRRL 30616]
MFSQKRKNVEDAIVETRRQFLKRQRAICDEEGLAPGWPDSDIWHADERTVLRTESTAWGPPDAAAARAEFEVVTNDNEQLLRTYHKGLAHIEHVFVQADNSASGGYFWVVTDPRTTTHVGGREVHIYPTHTREPVHATTTVYPYTEIPDARLRPLKTSEPLDATDIEGLQALYPTSTGVQVFIAGMVVMLYRSKSDLDRSFFARGRGNTWGAMPLFYAVQDIRATRVRVAKRPKKAWRAELLDIANKARIWARDKLKMKNTPVGKEAYVIDNTRTGFTTPAKNAVVEGMQYSWDKSAPYTAALMWRRDYDPDSLDYSTILLV